MSLIPEHEHDWLPPDEVWWGDQLIGFVRICAVCAEPQVAEPWSQAIEWGWKPPLKKPANS